MNTGKTMFEFRDWHFCITCVVYKMKESFINQRHLNGCIIWIAWCRMIHEYTATIFKRLSLHTNQKIPICFSFFLEDISTISILKVGLWCSLIVLIKLLLWIFFQHEFRSYTGKSVSLKTIVLCMLI